MSDAGDGGAPAAGDPEREDEEALANDLRDAASPPVGGDRATLLERARATMVEALTDLHATTAEMLGHLEHRADGPWQAEEAICYAADRGREREAYRRYLAAQHWHDTIRRRRSK